MQTWYRGRPSPFYRASHVELRAAVRKFVEEEVEPHCAEWDAAKRIPAATFRAAARCGLLAAVTGAPWPVGFAPGPPPVASPRGTSTRSTSSLLSTRPAAVAPGAPCGGSSRASPSGSLRS